MHSILMYWKYRDALATGIQVKYKLGNLNKLYKVSDIAYTSNVNYAGIEYALHIKINNLSHLSLQYTYTGSV